MKSLITLSAQEKFSIEKTMFIGNDLNYYEIMKACGLSACPSDSHPKNKKSSIV